MSQLLAERPAQCTEDKAVKEMELLPFYNFSFQGVGIRAGLLYRNPDSQTLIVKNRIGEYLKKCGISQTEAANLLGISSSQVQKIVSNHGNVTVELLYCFIKLFKKYGEIVDFYDLLVLPSDFKPPYISQIEEMRAKIEELEGKLLEIKKIAED